MRQTYRPATAAIGMIAAVVLVAGCGGPAVETLDSEEPRTATPLGLLEQRFSTFTGKRSSEDQLPRGLVPKRIAQGLGLDLDRSRFSRPYGKGSLYLVASARLTCMFGEERAIGSCWPTTTVTKGLATTTAFCGSGLDRGHVATFGIVPDGIETVTIIRQDGPDRTAPVIGNVYVALTSSKPPLPTHLYWTVDGRRITRPTGVPADAVTGCRGKRPPEAPQP